MNVLFFNALTPLLSVIFIGTCQMIIDTYKANASSALAANVLVRYICAGGTLLVAIRLSPWFGRADTMDGAFSSRCGDGSSTDVFEHAASMGL
jgi:hypothetical protein